MERLWAPWRTRYVVGPKPPRDECVFCAAAAGERDDQTYVLHRGVECFSMLNRFPYNGGHLMVLPYGHRGALADVSPSALSEMMVTAARWTAVLGVSLRAEGFNVGFNLGPAAGAGLADHLHLHVVPRWNGDTNFMPVVGGTKVIPQDLDGLYAQLTAGWASLAEDP